MNNFRIPTDEEVKEVLRSSPYTDWSFIYDALTAHGKVLVNVMPKGIRSALSNHYRNTSYKARIIKTKEGGCLVLLVSRE